MNAPPSESRFEMKAQQLRLECALQLCARVTLYESLVRASETENRSVENKLCLSFTTKRYR